MDFTDQVTLITGASSGIGKQIALDFAGRGAIVVGCGRSISRLKETLKEVRRTSPRSVMIGCDVGDAEQVQGMIAKVLDDFGKVDILINNAGVGMRSPFVETPLKTIEEMIRVNYLGAIYCTHELLPSMIARRSGHIVNISSGAGKIGTLNMAAYCGSKFALNGWAESLYHELKPLGIAVSLVCPGPVRTEFNRDFRDSEPKAPANLIVSAESVAQRSDQSHREKTFRSDHAALAGAHVRAAALYAELLPRSRPAPVRALYCRAGKIFAARIMTQSIPVKNFKRRKKTMSASRIAALAFALLMFSVPALAQLGPKDGADLAPTDLNRIKVGQPAPDFTLEDVDGKALALSSFQDKKSVVLVFYRGYW